MILSIKEVCDKYGVSESSLRTNFNRTQQTILKKHGVRLNKIGRGKNATYEEIEDSTLDRAVSMYQEAKEDFTVSKSTLQLVNTEFSCFLALILTPMLVFRGSFKDFCKYMEKPTTDSSIVAVKLALSQLESKGYISYALDRTDKTYFVAAVTRQTEVEMRIGVDMIRICKKIAEENNKRSWVPLLKIWLGIQILQPQQPFTINDLSKVTGLSKYQINQNKKLLEANYLFRSSKAYRYGYFCIGEEVDLNAFYN